MAIALIAWLVLSSWFTNGSPAHELNRDEAIAAAEAAILRNGCTDLLPLRDRPKLAADQSKVDVRFVMGHELMCPAVFALEGRVDGKAVWIVGFGPSHTYPEMRTDSRDRLVLMNKDGSKLRMENRTKRITRILKDNR
jgi:hypothetical protein